MSDSSWDGLRRSLDRGLELNVRRRPVAAQRVLRGVRSRLEDPRFDGVPQTDKAYVQARALVGEASSLVETGGDVARALMLLTEADDLAVSHDLKALRGAILGQRGLLKHRTGDLDGALSDITSALEPGIDKEPRDSIKLLLNRGSLRLDRGEADEAIEDLRASVELAETSGEAMLAVLATHNLGYAQYLRGDLPAALSLMRRAAAEASDDQLAALDVDQAQVLYEAGLLAEAVKVLESARLTLQATRMSRDLADVELHLSRCLRDLRRYEPAAAAARSAARRFARLGNEPWRLRAEIAQLQARLGTYQFRSGVPRAVARERAESALRLAAQGGELGPTATLGIVVPARLMAAEWLLMARDVERARALVEGLPRDLRYASLPVRLQREAVLAQIAFADLDRRAGRTAVARGQRILATHRASLGSVDAVTASAVHGLRLQYLDVKWAMRRSKGDAVFDALERGRATFSGPGRVRPSADARMAELLVKARAEIESARLLGPTASGQGLAARQQHLQEARRLQELARARSWHLSGETRPPRPVTARRLRSALRGSPAASAVVVNLAMLDGRVIAVRSDRNGTSLHRLAPLSDVVERARRARADFEVLANPLIPAALRTSAHASLDRVLRWLDDELVAPLAVEGDLHLAVRGMLLTVA